MVLNFRDPNKNKTMEGKNKMAVYFDKKLNPKEIPNKAANFTEGVSKYFQKQ